MNKIYILNKHHKRIIYNCFILVPVWKNPKDLQIRKFIDSIILYY